MFDVAADGEDLDAVHVEKIIAEVEFGEPERNMEFGIVGGQAGGSEEGDANVGDKELFGSDFE